LLKDRSFPVIASTSLDASVQSIGYIFIQR
jgi:hypothetical protein